MARGYHTNFGLHDIISRMLERTLALAILCSPILLPAAARTTHLVIDDSLLKIIDSAIPAGFHVIAKSRLEPANLVEALARGDSCVWIGDASGLPPDLWIGAFRPAQSELTISPAAVSPLILGEVPFRRSLVSSVYFKPVRELPYHNIDEEPRANLEPILDARDRFGRVVGYPAALVRYYAPSLVSHRFSGTQCFIFLFDRPGDALNADGWIEILKAIDIRVQAGLQLKRVSANFASYHSGESARIAVEIRNTAMKALAVEIRLYARAPNETGYRLLDRRRRIPDGEGESEWTTEIRLPSGAGLWTLRAEIWADPLQAGDLAIEGHPVPIDRMDIGVVVTQGPLTTPAILGVDGPGLRIDNQPGFWTGTNYYPSSSWWEWLWRDFRPLAADEDFASMRRSGYRIVRIWVDPILEEQCLRALDAAIYLAARHGIVLDVCIFTQWVRTLGFDRADGERVRFEFRNPRDFNVYGISFRNLALQREYAGVLAKRWRNAGNLMYNLSNETYIKDPDATQMDPDVVRWPGIPFGNGELRDSLLFQRWSDEITRAIRQSGALQPIVPGYLFTQMGGGDTYLADRHGAIEAWHSYSAATNAAAALAFVNPGCSGRPMMLEEFGTPGWNRADVYDGAVHAALGAGAAVAMSYEWGVRWLALEQSFEAAPLREILNGKPDPRWFSPVIDIARKWPKQVPGINFAPSGFYYGSIYSGTPFPAAAALALGRFGLLGSRLAPVKGRNSVYVLVPSAASAKTNADVIRAIERLQREKVIFGILQEDCLERLAGSVRFLIAPAALSEASTRRLALWSRTGVRVLKTEEDWVQSVQLPRVAVVAEAGENESITALSRPTERGRLYTFLSAGPPRSLKLTTPQGSVEFGLDNFGVLEQIAGSGISLIEAAGDVIIRGNTVFQVQSGRAIFSSDDGQPLDKSQRIRILATEPTNIRFTKTIRSVVALEPGYTKPIGAVTEAVGQSELKIGAELLPYVTLVEF